MIILAVGRAHCTVSCCHMQSYWVSRVEADCHPEESDSKHADDGAHKEQVQQVPQVLGTLTTEAVTAGAQHRTAGLNEG